jgi:hypothetical protein
MPERGVTLEEGKGTSQPLEKERATQGWQVCDICSSELYPQPLSLKAFPLAHQIKSKSKHIPQALSEPHRHKPIVVVQKVRIYILYSVLFLNWERFPYHYCAHYRLHCSSKLLYHKTQVMSVNIIKAIMQTPGHQAFIQKSSTVKHFGQKITM